MSAPLVPVDGHHPQPRTVEHAVEALRDGGLLGYPSDTTYALGCDAHQRRAVERLAQLKRRDPKKPFALLVADLSDLARYAQVSNFAYRILRQLAPGPFTFILPATRLVPELLLHKRHEVGLRIPHAPVARALAMGLGRPLVTTTATGEQGAPIPDAPTVRDSYGHGLVQVLDAGLRSGEQSTLVSLVGDRLEVLRPGAGVLEGT